MWDIIIIIIIMYIIQLQVFPPSNNTASQLHRLRTHGTGLETCHVSALNAKRSGHSVLREFAPPHRCQNAAVSTYHLWHLYLKDRSGSCGTILEKPWGL